ncbi:MAG: TonB C-terminal domain-containing protein [Deltaproteobacteria bacterium]|jgi:outer membrane biosynthesis protein TonB|nr:TonB C-terminal domain-containing protein [Deltaproteobacteria bacterium]
MLTPRNPYNPQEAVKDPNLFLVLGLSIILHGLVLSGAYYLPAIMNLHSSDELPYDVMTVQLIGALEPPAPAAPPAPVDPTIMGPDTVELPQSDPIIPQPTPLDQMITPVVPTEAIPIGETPPEDPIVPVTKIEDPPPKVAPPKVEEPPKPKPKPKTPNPEATLNKRIEEIRRKTEAANQDEAINSAIVNIARRSGKGDGSSSNQVGSSTQGNFVDPGKVPYYAQIRDIVRSNYIPPVDAIPPNLVVEFIVVIQPNGTISGKRLRRSSGNPAYDQSVALAIDRTRLPALPPAFNGQADNPVLSFSYEYLLRQ